MADAKGKDKKPPKKSSSHDEGGEPNLFVDALFWILLAIAGYSALKAGFSSLGLNFALPSLSSFFEFVFDKLQVYSIFLSLIFFIGIIYFNFKLGELAKASHDRLHGHGHGAHHGGDLHTEHHKEHGAAPPLGHRAAAHSHTSSAHADAHAPDRRFMMVETRINSFSEGDWRLAVIEADIILSDMLTKMGFEGDGVAEKLKKADKDSFATLDLAWEAHKIRNRITHDGPAFHISHDEAKRVVGLFKQVFDEFYFI